MMGGEVLASRNVLRNGKEIIRVRLRIIDLIKSFFVQPPDAERLSRWRGMFHALADSRVSPRLDEAVLLIKQRLATDRLQDLQLEFKCLFGDPDDNGSLSLSASDHLDGRIYLDTRAAVKCFFSKAGARTYYPISDTEDTLVLLFDFLATLLQNEKDGYDTAVLQAQLVTEFLVPFVERLETAAQRHDTASFYRDCITFTRGYLELEQQLLT
jgi:TorA maturation chaperone TorD